MEQRVFGCGSIACHVGQTDAGHPYRAFSAHERDSRSGRLGGLEDLFNA
jgi:hypothetical protein